jgi:hypothetical protein
LCSASTAIVFASSAIIRRLRSLFGGPTRTACATSITHWTTETLGLEIDIAPAESKYFTPAHA